MLHMSLRLMETQCGDISSHCRHLWQPKPFQQQLLPQLEPLWGQPQRPRLFQLLWRQTSHLAWALRKLQWQRQRPACRQALPAWGKTLHQAVLADMYQRCSLRLQWQLAAACSCWLPLQWWLPAC